MYLPIHYAFCSFRNIKVKDRWCGVYLHSAIGLIPRGSANYFQIYCIHSLPKYLKFLICESIITCGKK